MGSGMERLDQAQSLQRSVEASASRPFGAATPPAEVATAWAGFDLEVHVETEHELRWSLLLARLRVFGRRWCVGQASHFDEQIVEIGMDLLFSSSPPASRIGGDCSPPKNSSKHRHGRRTYPLLNIQKSGT